MRHRRHFSDEGVLKSRRHHFGDERLLKSLKRKLGDEGAAEFTPLQVSKTERPTR